MLYYYPQVNGKNVGQTIYPTQKQAWQAAKNWATENVRPFYVDHLGNAHGAVISCSELLTNDNYDVDGMERLRRSLEDYYQCAAVQQ
jgi:hypothetical protein